MKIAHPLTTKELLRLASWFHQPVDVIEWIFDAWTGRHRPRRGASRRADLHHLVAVRKGLT